MTAETLKPFLSQTSTPETSTESMESKNKSLKRLFVFGGIVCALLFMATLLSFTVSSQKLYQRVLNKNCDCKGQ